MSEQFFLICIVKALPKFNTWRNFIKFAFKLMEISKMFYPIADKIHESSLTLFVKLSKKKKREESERNSN